MSALWLSEGTAARTRVQRTPVRHLLVRGGGPRGQDWTLWCSSGKAIEDSPHGDRMCRTCVQLAAEAVEAGDLDPSDIEARGWLAATERVSR